MEEFEVNTFRHNGLCDAAESILCIIGLQYRLVTSMPDKAMSRVLQNIQKLLQTAKSLDIPVIACELSPYLLGDVVDEITDYLPKSTNFIERTSFSCCGDESFVKIIKSSERSQVILTGLEAHVGVLQTALEVTAMGLDVFVPSDTTGSRYFDNFKSTLERMRNAGINITSTDSTLSEWQRCVDTERKEFLYCEEYFRSFT